MARELRRGGTDGWFHVMNRGVDQQIVFDAARHADQFLDLLGDASSRTETQLHCYCLMPHHFHLLVRGAPSGVAKMMQLLSSRYTRWYNIDNHRDGALFRGRYTSRFVSTARYALNASRYIHRNPIGRVGADGLVDYPWSSLGAYVGRVDGPHWLHTETILAEANGKDAYLDFVTCDTE